MKRAIGWIPLVIKKPLSFIIDHNKVAPIKRGNTQDPSKPPPLKGEEGVIIHHPGS
jgi:hypothetical protein